MWPSDTSTTTTDALGNNFSRSILINNTQVIGQTDASASTPNPSNDFISIATATLNELI